MSNPITKIFSRVLKVSVHGSVNQLMVEKITLGLKKSSYFPIEAIMVNISSSGGSLTQCKSLCDILKNFSSSKNAPLYCFAEDQCLGSANIILTTGVKSYANNMSMLGDFGYSWTNLNFAKVAAKNNIRKQSITSSPNKTSYDWFKEMTPQCRDFTQKQLQMQEEQLHRTIMTNRSSRISRKMTKEEFSQKIFKHPLVSPGTAIQAGLIDEIKNCEDLIEEKFKGSKVVLANRRHPMDHIRFLAGHSG